MNDYLLSRYERQLVLPEWSMKKQELLAKTHLTLQPDMTLGALYAAAAGVGGIAFSEPDKFNPEFETRLKSINSTIETGTTVPGSFELYALVAPRNGPLAVDCDSMLICYSVQNGMLHIGFSRGSDYKRTIQYALSNFASSYHVISLLAVSILLDEVSQT
jgi:hypothetical protein